jgi:hypothetical protein
MVGRAPLRAPGPLRSSVRCAHCRRCREEPAVYHDDFVGEVEAQLQGVRVVLVWHNLALSITVRRLEASLGVRLSNRTTRSVAPTSPTWRPPSACSSMRSASKVTRTERPARQPAKRALR